MEYTRLMKEHLLEQLRRGVQENELDHAPTGEEFQSVSKEFHQWFGYGDPHKQADDEALRLAKEELVPVSSAE